MASNETNDVHLPKNLDTMVLTEIVAEVRSELRLEGNIHEVVDKACEQLGGGARRPHLD